MHSQSDVLILIPVITRMQAPVKPPARHNPKKIKLNILISDSCVTVVAGHNAAGILQNRPQQK